MALRSSPDVRFESFLFGKEFWGGTCVRHFCCPGGLEIIREFRIGRPSAFALLSETDAKI